MTNDYLCKPPWTVLLDEKKEYAEAINEFIGRMLKLSTLDDKTFNLLWIGIQAALDYDLAVITHVELALKAGAIKDEIIGATAIAAAAAGPKGFVKCFPKILAEFERLEKQEK